MRVSVMCHVLFVRLRLASGTWASPIAESGFVVSVTRFRSNCERVQLSSNVTVGAAVGTLVADGNMTLSIRSPTGTC
jgi:hypothetical protein